LNPPSPGLQHWKNPKKCTFLGAIKIEVAFDMDMTHAAKFWGWHQDKKTKIDVD
jgi:hypothetical protein